MLTFIMKNFRFLPFFSSLPSYIPVIFFSFSYFGNIHFCYSKFIQRVAKLFAVEHKICYEITQKTSEIKYKKKNNIELQQHILLFIYMYLLFCEYR